MNLRKYSEWQPTADRMHMILQMMGKTKLHKMPPQPEWSHTLLSISSTGFTTGLIPDGNASFEVSLNLVAKRVEIYCTSGSTACFSIGGNKSTADDYKAYMNTLDYLKHPCPINPIPQEYYSNTPFNKMTEPCIFDGEAAIDYLNCCELVYKSLLSFSSHYRGKKIQPTLFWGTFDLTTVLFTGDDMPFSGEGIIEKVAFDERFIEFGFWPGDTAADDPALFVLPYPFLEQDLPSEDVSPKEAWFSPEAKEYFLKLSDVLSYENPQQIIVDFYNDAFKKLIAVEQWENVAWFEKPLLI